MINYEKWFLNKDKKVILNSKNYISKKYKQMYWRRVNKKLHFNRHNENIYTFENFKLQRIFFFLKSSLRRKWNVQNTMNIQPFILKFKKFYQKINCTITYLPRNRMNKKLMIWIFFFIKLDLEEINLSICFVYFILYFRNWTSGIYSNV